MIRDYIRLTLLAIIAVALSVLAASQIFYYGKVNEAYYVRINRITGTRQFCNIYAPQGWRSLEDRAKGNY